MLMPKLIYSFHDIDMKDDKTVISFLSFSRIKNRVIIQACLKRNKFDLLICMRWIHMRRL